MQNAPWFIPLVTALLSAVGFLLFRLTRTLLQWFRKRVRVIRITEANDLFDSAMTLHETLFDESVRDDRSYIERWLLEMEVDRGTPNSDCRLEDYFLVAVQEKRFLGYLYAQCYEGMRLAIISYFGVYPGLGSDAASRALLREFRKLMKKNHSRCRWLVTELNEDRRIVDVGKRKTRLDTLRWQVEKHARLLGYEARQIDIQYLQPKLDPQKKGRPKSIPLELILIAPNGTLGETLPKADVLRILRFLFLDVYGDCFEHDKRLDNVYRDYLKRLYSAYSDSIPNDVKLKKCKSKRYLENNSLDQPQSAERQ